MNPSADLQITAADAPDPVVVGGNVTYTLTLRNNGPSPAAGVTVSDTLPAGLTHVSTTTTKGTCSGTATVSCNLGTVNAGAANDVTVTIVASVGQAAVPSVTNTASASSSTGDPSAANNQASAATTVNPSADLQITATDAPDPVFVGGNVTYTLTVHNNGPSPAAGVTVSDSLPAALTLVSATSTNGTCSGHHDRELRDRHDQRRRRQRRDVTIVAHGGSGRGAERHQHGHGVVVDGGPERGEQPGERRHDREPLGRRADHRDRCARTRSLWAATSPTRSRSATTAPARPPA